jgi:protein SCO1/2
MNKAIVFWLALLLLFCGGAAIWTGWKYSQRPRPEAALNQEPILKEFALIDRTGKTVRSRDLDGQVRVSSFFFSACPSICRQQNRRVEELVKEFGPQGAKFLSITCDPDTDTPAVLAEYARQFHAPEKEWHFLTGELLYLRRVGAEMYQLPVDKQVHSENLIVQDKWGNIRGRYHWNDAAEMAAMKRKLTGLLAEQTPPPEEPVKQAKPQDVDDDGLIDK